MLVIVYQFHICSDASEYQFEPVILPQNIPVALYFCKCTITQKIIPHLVETFCNFSSILLGVDINTYINHKNLTFNTHITHHALQLHLYIESF